MQAGVVFTPAGGRRLKSVGTRRRSIGLGRLLQFSWHALILGFVLTFVTAFFTGPPIRMFVFQLWFFALLFAFIGWKSLRRGRTPRWASGAKDRPSRTKMVVGVSSLAISALLVYSVRTNVDDFNYYRGRPAIEVMEACSSYTYTGFLSETLQPSKWWCGSMEEEVLKGRDEAFKKWLKTH